MRLIVPGDRPLTGKLLIDDPLLKRMPMIAGSTCIRHNGADRQLERIQPTRDKPAKLKYMLISRKFIRVAAMVLMLCISVQAIAFASPACAHLNIPDQMLESANCHQDSLATDSCCQQQCQNCSMLSATVSTGAASTSSTPAAADRIVHVPVHFYQHIPLPHFRPPLLTV